jgi:hypothetical protein
MNSLGAIACGIGLHDSLNPTIFMASAVFIAGGFWLASSTIKLFWLRLVFALAYVFGFLLFTFGPGQILIFRKEFFAMSKIIYLILSIGAFILGAVFLKDWYLLARPTAAKDMSPEKIKTFKPNSLAVSLLAIILALLLSALTAIGPINNYILLLGNISLLKGQWQAVMPLMLGYLIFSMWPVWFVWVLLSIKNQTPRFLKIICASVFFTASSCIILTFR